MNGDSPKRESSLPEDQRFQKPLPVDTADMAFGAMGPKLRKLMPTYSSLPEEFRRERDPYSSLVNKWFFSGIRKDALKAKPGIDANAAWRHMKAIMASWEPKHEHKTAAVAYLMSLWFDPPQEKAA